MLLGDDDDDKGMMMCPAKDNGGNLLQQVTETCIETFTRNTCIVQPLATSYPGFSWDMSRKRGPWALGWRSGWITLKKTGMGGWVEIVQDL